MDNKPETKLQNQADENAASYSYRKKTVEELLDKLDSPGPGQYDIESHTNLSSNLKPQNILKYHQTLRRQLKGSQLLSKTLGDSMGVTKE